MDEQGTSERYGKISAAWGKTGVIQPSSRKPFPRAAAAAGAAGSMLLFAVCCPRLLFASVPAN